MSDLAFWLSHALALVIGIMIGLWTFPFLVN
jgi:uncharacterized membrane-anchored protein YhcB (DUF1043 family)